MADEGFRLAWDGDRIAAAIAGASFAGLQLAAEHLLQVSSDLAPHEEGSLSRSGEVSTDETTREVAVSFDTPYAVRQHEELDWDHDAGKQAKYLEEPMSLEAGTMIALIATASRKPFG